MHRTLAADLAVWTAQQVVDEHGVNYMAAICAICKSQFTKVLPYYKHPMDMIGSVHGLVSTAIVLNAKTLFNRR